MTWWQWLLLVMWGPTLAVGILLDGVLLVAVTTQRVKERHQARPSVPEPRQAPASAAHERVA